MFRASDPHTHSQVLGALQLLKAQQDRASSAAQRQLEHLQVGSGFQAGSILSWLLRFNDILENIKE